MRHMIEVTELVEHDDGSCTLHVELSAEGARLLIQEGLRSVLQREVDKAKEEEKDGVSTEV